MPRRRAQPGRSAPPRLSLLLIATLLLGAQQAGAQQTSSSLAVAPGQPPFVPAGDLVHIDPSTSGRTSADVDPHAAVFQESMYPSANECAACHQEIYDEWSSSSHAYASISPMFHKFEQTINNLSNGTIGYFCMRCHASVGTTLGETRDTPLWERSQVSREGITCITCHRVAENYGRVNGERHINPGPLTDPVFGRDDRVLSNVLTGPAPAVHAQTVEFEQIDKSDFCVSCHQVAVHPGIKLEVVWDQYRASPARRDGVTCQDCHMGTTPGRNEGFATGPAAVVTGNAINPEGQRSNHAFFGPGYPAVHPGVFPHNPRAAQWSVDQWLTFDWRAGWGLDSFEDTLAIDAGGFPPAWESVDDRYEAREIIEENLAKLEEKKELRRQVMENGSRIDGPYFDSDPRTGRELSFHYEVTNTNAGHNLPSGSLGAQPELWLNVALTGPDGNRLWESGYVDSRGDMADLHSRDVLNGSLPHDDQLFNLQTKFLTTNVKGTDREMYLPINVDIDQLPFIRPAGQPVSVMNHPPFVRMEGRSLPPLSSRDAKYSVPANLLTQPGEYTLSVRMRSRAEPIYFMDFVGATEEMVRDMNEGMLDIHGYSVTFEVR